MFQSDREICVKGSGENILSSVTAGQCSLTSHPSPLSLLVLSPLPLLSFTLPSLYLSHSHLPLSLSSSFHISPPFLLSFHLSLSLSHKTRLHGGRSSSSRCTVLGGRYSGRFQRQSANVYML